MGVSLATYEQVALEDGDTVWEYVCGQLREKPSMTQEHNDVTFYLAHQLASQLDRAAFRVRSNAGRLRTAAGNAYVPDVSVLPIRSSLAQSGTRNLETYDEALPFVAEVWSPSTGAYDIDTKLPDYFVRGDQVIWRVHPYEKSVRAYTRNAQGSYDVTEHSSGRVPIASLPDVTIDLAVLFA